MAKNLIILSLFAALLLFGCLGAGEVTEEEKEAPAGDGAPPTGDGAPPTEDGDGAPPTEDGDGVIDFAGLDYAAVMALSVPIECDITTYVDGEPITVKLYAKGENEIRKEYVPKDMEDIDCPKFVWITKDNNIYMCCEGGDFLPDSTCDCFAFICEEDEEPAEAGAASGYTALDLGDVPATQVSCWPWLYDPSKFQVPGKACTMDEYIQEMTGGAYDYDY